MRNKKRLKHHKPNHNGKNRITRKRVFIPKAFEPGDGNKKTKPNCETAPVKEPKRALSEKEKERKAKRELATRQLINIDDTERNRRKLIGQATAVLTTVIYGATFYFHSGIVARAASIYLPLAFSVGFYESGKKGL